MARVGDVLENQATGERIVFRKVEPEALEYEITFVPSGFAAQSHLHPSQEERHEVLEGRLGIVVDGRDRVLGPGDVEVVPPRTPHRIYAVGEEPVRAVFESRPALRSAELLERLFELGGKPGPLQLAAIGHEFAAEGYPTSPPLAVQRIVLPPLAALARATANEYVFVDEWDVDAPQEAVFDALSDGRTYPDWWKPVYLSVEGDERVTYHHFKGKLPYTLKTRTEVVSKEPPDRVEVMVDGDLRGKGLWTLTPRDGKTHVRFDWIVFADRPLLRALTPVLRPLFRWNHAWAIARAREGLEPYARRRAAAATAD